MKAYNISAALPTNLTGFLGTKYEPLNLLSLSLAKFHWGLQTWGLNSTCMIDAGIESVCLLQSFTHQNCTSLDGQRS